MEKFNRLEKKSALSKSPLTSNSLRKLIERDIIKLLDYDEEEYEEMMEEEELEKEREKEELRNQPIIPGQNASKPQFPPKPKEKPKQPKPVKQKAYHLPPDNYLTEIIRKVGNKWAIFSHKTGKKLGTYPTRAAAVKALQRMKAFSNQSYEDYCDCPYCSDIKEGEYNDIEEWLGFNYKNYLAEILVAIKGETFEDLKAKNKIEEEAGKFNKKQLTALKEVLDDGFSKGSNIREISKDIDKKVKPKDLLKMSAGNIVLGAGGIAVVLRGKENRGISIARSEITRVANKGAIEHYKKGGVNHFRWVASWGPRTCPDCEGLDGQIFTDIDLPPLPFHSMCRCTTIPVSEVV